MRVLLSLTLSACTTYPATLDEYLERQPEAEIRPGEDPDTFVVSTGWVLHRLGVAQALALSVAICRNRGGYVDPPWEDAPDVIDLPIGPIPDTRTVTRDWIEERWGIERDLKAQLGVCAAEAAVRTLGEGQ